MKTRKNSAMNIVLVAIVDETDIGFPAAHFLDQMIRDTSLKEICGTTRAERMTRI